jgi:hypothetical protein
MHLLDIRLRPVITGRIPTEVPKPIPYHQEAARKDRIITQVRVAILQGAADHPLHIAVDLLHPVLPEVTLRDLPAALRRAHHLVAHHQVVLPQEEDSLKQ